MGKYTDYIINEEIFKSNDGGSPSGDPVDMRVDSGYIQWRYGSNAWQNLIAVATLEGREVELQKSATHIQWRYVGDLTWTDLVLLSDLQGPQGLPGEDGTNTFQITGNTSGDNSITISPDKLFLSGGNNITLSQSVNGTLATIGFNVPSQSIQTQNIIPSISAGTASVSSGGVVFSNSNGLAFGLNGGTITGSYTVPVISSASISAGTASGTLSNLVFSNSNSISFGYNAGTITGSFSQSVQTQSIMRALSAGTTSMSSGTIVLSNSNNVSFGLNGATVTASASFNQSVQTQSIMRALSAGTTSMSSGTIVLSNSNNMSFGLNGATVTGSFSYTQSTASISAGTTSTSLTNIVFSNSNNVSFGLNGGTITASATMAAGAGDGYNILAAGTQTAGTAASVRFSNSNGISFGMSNSSVITASYTVPNVPAQTYQPVAFSGSNASSTASTLSFGNSNGLTHYITNGSLVASYTVPSVPAQTYQPIAFSGSNASSTASTLSFGNSNGLSHYITNGSLVASYTVPTVPTQTNQTIGIYGVSNTTRSSSGTLDARSLSIQGAGGVSVGYTNGSVVVSGITGGGAGDGYNIIAANASTAATTGTIVFSNSNNITFGLNGTVITASASLPAGAGDGYNIIAVAGSTAGNSNTVVFGNANGVSFGLDNNTVTASVGIAPNRQYIQIMEGERLTSIVGLSATNVTNRPMFNPFWLDGVGLQINTMRFCLSGVGSSNRSLGMTCHAGIYIQTNGTQLSLLGSDSMSFSITASASSTVWNGFRMMDFTRMSSITLTQEGRYALGFMCRPVSANATWASVQLWGGDNTPAISGFFINNTTSASNATSNLVPYWGAYTTTTSALPDTVGSNQIGGGNSASIFDYFAIIKEI